VTFDFEVVWVIGTTGSMRLDGCCWGYSGEGPRAVRDLLLSAGVSADVAHDTAFRNIRSSDPGHPERYVSTAELARMPRRRIVDWRVSL
jgi:hypothetical protein